MSQIEAGKKRETKNSCQIASSCGDWDRSTLHTSQKGMKGRESASPNAAVHQFLT